MSSSVFHAFTKRDLEIPKRFLNDIKIFNEVDEGKFEKIINYLKDEQLTGLGGVDIDYLKDETNLKISDLIKMLNFIMLYQMLRVNNTLTEEEIVEDLGNITKREKILDFLKEIILEQQSRLKEVIKEFDSIFHNTFGDIEYKLNVQFKHSKIPIKVEPTIMIKIETSDDDFFFEANLSNLKYMINQMTEALNEMVSVTEKLAENDIFSNQSG